MSQRNTGVPLQVTDPDARATNLMAEACTVRQVLDHVGGKWSVSILLAAIAGPVRFSQLERMVEGISRRMLTLTLRNLERDGLLERENDPGDRRRTLIWLTPGGHEALRRDREVLDVDLLARALARLPPGQAGELNAAMRALIECAQSDGMRTYGGESHYHDVKL